jgi:LysR family glycine cleavage system transcriptional activator
MSYELPPLIWLRTFEAAARRSSFTAAARELNLTQPAVSHHIRSLESHLGSRLFAREARRIALTDLGRAYLPAVRRAFGQISAATGGLFGVTGERSVTVRATATFASLCLAPKLGEFRRQTPNVDVRIYTAIWAEGLDGDQADLDIRYGEGPWDGYDGVPLRAEDSIPVCHPALVEGAVSGLSVADIANLDQIRIMGCENFWHTWFTTGGLAAPPRRRGIAVDNSMAALQIAAAGHGVALVLESFAAPYLEDGRLIAPVSHRLPGHQAHYVLVPEGEGALRPEVLVFRDWLLATFGDAGTAGSDVVL